MKRMLMIAVCVAMFVAGWMLAAPVQAEPAQKVESANKVQATQLNNWHEDTVCRQVFFAVLEGLYTDGVSNEVVNALIPPAAAGENPVKHSFVLQCPLCHSVYEALRVYQARPSFHDQTQNTFGSRMSKDIPADLASPHTPTRLKALAPVIERWVSQHLARQRLTPEEHAQFMAEFRKRAAQGKQCLQEHMKQKDSHYNTWSLYWGCAACNGVTSVTRQAN